MFGGRQLLACREKGSIPLRSLDLSETASPRNGFPTPSPLARSPPAPLLGLSRADSVLNQARRMDSRLRARPQLADELQQIMERIEPETKNQV